MPRPFTIALIAPQPMRHHCRTILTRAGEPPVAARSAPLTSAKRLVQSYRPAAIVLDAVASPLRALFVLRTLKRLSPCSHILLIGAQRTPIAFIVAALRRGASGHIAVRDLSRDLPKALRTVAAGEPWLSRQLGAVIVAEIRKASSPESREQPRYA